MRRRIALSALYVNASAELHLCRVPAPRPNRPPVRQSSDSARQTEQQIKQGFRQKLDSLDTECSADHLTLDTRQAIGKHKYLARRAAERCRAPDAHFLIPQMVQAQDILHQINTSSLCEMHAGCGVTIHKTYWQHRPVLCVTLLLLASVMVSIAPSVQRCGWAAPSVSEVWLGGKVAGAQLQMPTERISVAQRSGVHNWKSGTHHGPYVDSSHRRPRRGRVSSPSCCCSPPAPPRKFRAN